MVSNEVIAITVRLDAAMHEELRGWAFEDRTTMATLVREAIREYIVDRYVQDRGLSSA
jgi:predicted DNA-binding protein